MITNPGWPRVLMLAIALHVPAANAARPAMSDSEFRAMEPVCQAIGMGEVDGVFWAEALNRPENRHILDQPQNAMAVGAGWFHHYCWAKLSKHRFFTAKTALERRNALIKWREGMAEIVSHKIDWPYTHLIYKDIAESYFYEKNYARTIAEAERALEINREHPSTYALIADAYAEMKNRSKALEYVTEGLKYNPDSRALKRRYTELGGELPFPEPIVKTAPEPAPRPETPATPPPQVEPASDGPAAQPSQNSGIDSEPKPDEKPAANPYCRFCP